MPVGREGNVKWVDGLRGVASLLVVTTHLARGWEGDLFSSTTTEAAAPRLLQLPYLRVLVQGRIGVAIFAFVTGYVCALKPIRLCRQGQHEAALASVAKSALRRFPRLFLPAAAATCLTWLAAQLGLFTIAKNQDSWWIAVGAPERSVGAGGVGVGVGGALYELLFNLVTTWTWGTNRYDANQWTLLPLVKGSTYVYAFMVATAYVKPKYRMLASLGLWVYFFCASDSAFGMQFFWGTLLADLQNHDTVAALIASRPRASAVLSGASVLVGLTFASFPEAHAEWMTWSRLLMAAMRAVLPGNPDYARFGSGIGLEFLTLGVVLSPSLLQRALAGRHLLFFGRMSFAVYLLHGPLLRTTLVWMLYGVRRLPDHEDEDGRMVATRLTYPGGLALVAWQVVWLPMLYGLASLWTAYVDAWCDRMTNKLVDHVKLEASEKVPVLPIS